MAQATDEVRALAEAVFGALNAGDLDAFTVLMADDVQFTSMVAEAEGATFRGHDGIREWWDTVPGAFQDLRWESLEVRGSDDRAVTHFRMSGTLAGVPVEQTMWQAVEGAALLVDAQALWTELERPLEAARFGLMAGFRLRDHDPARAGQLLDAAAVECERMGVAHLATRARALMVDA